MFVHVCVCIYVYTHAYTHVYTHVYVYVYVYVYPLEVKEFRLPRSQTCSLDSLLSPYKKSWPYPKTLPVADKEPPV